MSRLYQPNVKSLRPTAQQKRELKAFKLEVEKRARNAYAMRKVYGTCLGGVEATIGNMECLFYPRNQKAIDKALGRWATTRW
jgi:hypothetical protein